MRKFILAILLALICAAPTTMTGCAFLSEQYEELHSMEEAKFERLAAQVEAVAKLGGQKLAEKISDQEIRQYIVAGINVVLSKDTKEEFIEFLSKLKINPEYSKYIIPALSAALDLIEAQTGFSFSLDDHIHPRDLALIRAMLRGLRDGISTQDLVFVEINVE